MPVVQEHQEPIARVQVSCQGEVQRPPVQGLRPTILGSGSMKSRKTEGRDLKSEQTLRRASRKGKITADSPAARELKNLMNDLHIQFGKVRQKAAWLALKRSEFQEDDAISFFDYLQAEEDFATEVSLLSGHALMVQQLASKKRIRLDRYSKYLLQQIQAYSRRFQFM